MDVPDVKGIALSGPGPASAKRLPEQEATPAPEAAASPRQARMPGVETEGPRTPRVVPELPQRAGSRLRMDEASNRVVVQILDETNHVIKQIPPEELLEIAARFRRFNGLIFDHKV